MALTMTPPPGMPPERILLFGQEGTGKTSAVLSLARRLPDAHFHIIDTDYSSSYGRMIATEYIDVGENGNTTLHVVGPWDWPKLLSTVKEVQRSIEPGDWMVVDSMTPSWQSVRDHYTEQVHGTSIDDYLLDIRIQREKAGKKGANLEAFDGWTDWSVINSMYFPLYRFITQHPGHLVITAEADRLGDNDGKGMRDVYGPHGFKPAGQKKIGFLTQTVLLTKKNRDGFLLSTVKDRGRVDLDEVELDDFAKQYLQQTAGWKPRPWKPEA